MLLKMQVVMRVQRHIALVFDAASDALENSITITVNNFPMLAVAALTYENGRHNFSFLLGHPCIRTGTDGLERFVNQHFAVAVDGTQ